MKKQKPFLDPDYFRNIIFGAEDSLVSTVGVLFGVASANASQNLVITTGLIVIVVEAISMGAGSFLSEQSTHEYDKKTKHNDSPLIGGIIMFFSYFGFGSLSLIPYTLMPVDSAKWISAILSFILLFFVGYAPYKSIKAGARMVLIAGLATTLGFVIGELGQSY